MISVTDVCHDVAVVGGGIGGAYTEWKLRQHGLSVGLYELSDRLGGRFYTEHFPQSPDIPIELGAMRFSKEDHPILYQTIQEVGLKTDVFAGHVYLTDDSLFLLRGKYLRNRDFKENAVPYNLRANEKRDIHEIKRYLTQKTNFSGELSLLNNELPYLVSEDGVRLTNQTKHSLHMNYQLVSITKENGDIYNLGFRKTRTADGKTRPTSQTIAVCSQRVILTVPTSVLPQINLEVLHKRHIISNLNTLSYHPAVKLFFEYDFPWWADHLCNFDSYCENSNMHYYLQHCPKSATQCPSSCGDSYKRGIGSNLHSDLPIDVTFDFGISSKTGKAVLLAAYSVHDIWKELQKHGDYMNQGYHSVSTEVVRHAHMYLARLYNISVKDIPTPTDGIIFNWDVYPYVAPFSTSKPGIDWEQVWRTIHKPAVIDDICIASGSYSKRMSDVWSEHCLEAVEDILDQYF